VVGRVEDLVDGEVMAEEKVRKEVAQWVVREALAGSSSWEQPTQVMAPETVEECLVRRASQGRWEVCKGKWKAMVQMVELLMVFLGSGARVVRLTLLGRRVEVEHLQADIWS